jgi:hypothetical protein
MYPVCLGNNEESKISSNSTVLLRNKINVGTKSKLIIDNIFYNILVSYIKERKCAA